MTEVNGTVGIRRAVVQQIGGLALCRLAQLVVEAHLGPAGQTKRFILRQIRLHRKGGLRQT